MALRPNAGQDLLIQEVSVSQRHTSFGRFLWTSDQLLAETSNWQHTQHTNIHALGGIRIHNASRRAAVDPHLRPRGHWNLLLYNITRSKFTQPTFHFFIKIPDYFSIMLSWHEFKNSVALAVELLRSQPFTSSHFHLLIIVETAAFLAAAVQYQFLYSCCAHLCLQMCRAARCDRQRACPLVRFRTLCTFFFRTCCTLMTPWSQTFMKWRWILMGDTRFGSKKRLIKDNPLCIKYINKVTLNMYSVWHKYIIFYSYTGIGY